ncbi:MAG TPA: tryptophan synthase subunit alpha [Ferruginibacter sp.]|nr:tryptophan synthase subunit alpha [Ferruginibacter sp.]
MSKIQTLFKNKSNKVLNVYCTAGYPELASTVPVMKALQQNGADLIEIGMPYSDPLADGEVIQESGSKALSNGMTIEILFTQLKQLRSDNPPSGDGGITVPIILMGYMNPVMQYGFEKFCAKAAEVGISGLILPDLPIYEFETQYGAIIKKYGLDFIFLVTPETSEERIRKIDALTTGFIYAVSSSSTTGNNKVIADQEPYFKKLQSMKLTNPILVGFGIKDKATFSAACKYTNGAIIGSAYIKALANTSNIDTTTKEFLNTVLN